MTLLFLIVLGLIVAYVLFIRPVLKALPALKAFYAQADGFWAKLSALGGHSATIAWGYLVTAVGFAVTWIEPLGKAVGAPELKNQITATLQSNPQVLRLCHDGGRGHHHRGAAALDREGSVRCWTHLWRHSTHSRIGREIPRLTGPESQRRAGRVQDGGRL